MMLTLTKCIPLLLLCMTSISHSRRDGASQTSCYNHIIIHLQFGVPHDVFPCASNPAQCSSLNLTVSCPGELDQICCRDFSSKTLYTNCDYMFQWSTATNLGFLVQARMVPETTTTFDPSTTIVGTWNNGSNHQPLYCNSSSSAVDEVPVPNSVTHSTVYTETDGTAPQNINMTWYSNTTNTTSADAGNVNIVFFYTIARDISTNFLPYTKLDLNFQLSPYPTATDPPDITVASTKTATTAAATTAKTAGTRGSSSFLPTAATIVILVLLSVFMCS